MRMLAWLAAAVVVVMMAGAALASIPDSSGVIHGCYLTSGNPNVRGALRVIDTEAGETCGSGETAISWNQEGPQGPTGPEGEPGVSGYEVVFAHAVFPVGIDSGVVAECSAGKQSLGGGFVSVADSGVTVYVSAPLSQGENNTGWLVRAKNDSTQSWDIQAWAVCAFVT